MNPNKKKGNYSPPPFLPLTSLVSATPLFRLFPISLGKTHTSFVPPSPNIETLQNTIETLLAIIENQKQTIVRLEARVAELESRLGLTSRNSSFPPSHDIIKPVRLRQKIGRKAGGQKNI